MELLHRVRQNVLVVMALTAFAACDSPLEPSLSPSDEASAVRAASGRVYVPKGIDASGRSDVTQELNKFIASVPDGSTISFQKNGKYRIDYTLWILDRKDLTIEGNGALFYTTIPGPYGYVRGWILDKRNRNRSHWSIKNSSGIKVRNLKVRGANPYAGLHDLAYYPQFEAQHGFNVINSKDVIIEGTTVTDVWGDFVYVGGSDFARNIVIRNNHFDRNGRQGIAITAGDRVLIEDNYIGHTRRASIDLEPNSARGGATNIDIRDNTFGPGRLLWIASGNSQGTIENITIKDNLLLEGRSMSVHVRSPKTRRHNFKILGNTSRQITGGSGDGLLSFENVNGVEIRDNQVLFDKRRGMTAVFAEHSCAVTVDNNRFNGVRQVVRMSKPVCR